MSGGASPSDLFIYIYIHIYKDWGRNNVAGAKRIPRLSRPGRQPRRSFSSAQTSRRAAGPGGRGRGAVRRGCSAQRMLRAPRPYPPARTPKASAGQSGGPGGYRLPRKGFSVPSAPTEEKYGHWGRVVVGSDTHLPGVAAPGHSSPSPSSFPSNFGLIATFSLHPKAAPRAALFFFFFLIFKIRFLKVSFE